MSTLEKLQKIKNLATYKQILSDSFGGVVYDVDNAKKYDTGELLRLWNNLQPYEQEQAGGIMQGAIRFVTS